MKKNSKILDEVLANYFLSNDPTDTTNIDKNLITKIMQGIASEHEDYPEVTSDPDKTDESGNYGTETYGEE